MKHRCHCRYWPKHWVYSRKMKHRCHSSQIQLPTKVLLVHAVVRYSTGNAYMPVCVVVLVYPMERMRTMLHIRCSVQICAILSKCTEHAEQHSQRLEVCGHLSALVAAPGIYLWVRGGMCKSMHRMFSAYRTMSYVVHRIVSIRARRILACRTRKQGPSDTRDVRVPSRRTSC